MRIAVAGGTGAVGRHVVDAIRREGHEPVVLTRSSGVDVRTGAGLVEALTDVAVVIDVTNTPTNSRRKAIAFFEAATANLQRAGRQAGVGHLVALSIVGCDRVPIGYYAGKVRQEECLAAGELPWTVLRATQFFDFPIQLLDRLSPAPVLTIPRWRTQPVAAREVADALVELALAEPAGKAPDIAGPEVHQMADLVRDVLQKIGRRRPVVSFRLPGAAGRAIAGDGSLPTEPGPRGKQTFSQWLATLNT
ncbi:MAG TPA: NAD(P)H-binding protein [Mycobacteriales bacterium]|jgi:uncharacterized protein YbjT (DUF2867 family)|nr:NAD(P)H-binding protein [Mycobacteriales bacterium]